MLVLTSKKYEIEEPIMVKNEKDETLYEFKMQITPEEMKKIKDILFDEKSLNLTKKFQKEKDEDKQLEINEELEKRGLELQEKFEIICFKEHREPFKEKCGDYKYLEMVEMMYDFFMNAFIDKRVQQVNTISTNLKRIGNN